MKNNIFVKGLVLGIMLIVIGMIVNPTNASNAIVEKSFISAFDRNTLYVGGSGPGNYSSIQDAIDNASDGDTIFVYEDSSPYFEFLSVNKSIHLLGEDKNTTIIDGSSERREVIHITADDVCVRGFTVINRGKETILIHSNNTRIINNILGPNISGWSGNGIRLYHAHNNVIEGNEISRTFNAIEISNSNNNTIQDNYVKKSWLYGIWLSSSIDNRIISNNLDTGSPVGSPGSYKGIRLTGSINNTITNNIMTSQDEDCINGMEVWDSKNNVIKGNTFIQCGFQWYGYYDNVIENNTVNGKPLVYLMGQSDLVIDDAGQVVLIQCSDSTIKDLELANIPKGVELFSSNNCVITNIVCIDSGYGIDLDSSENNQITNNLLVNNLHGIYVDDGSTNTVVSNNIVRQNLYTGIYSNAAQVTIEGNQVNDNNRGIITGGIFALQNNIISNNVTNNWNGILLNSISTKVTQNVINDNVNGIQIRGSSDRNHIISNEIINNECGLNITYEPESRRSNGNWILKNNFIGNNKHAYFDSSYKNHWLRNYWEGKILPPVIIPGMWSFYQVHPWSGAIISEKHIPWIDVDWIPALLPH